jgi:hypothetical protein
MATIGRSYVKKLVSAVKGIPNKNEDQNSDRDMSDLDIENDNDGLSDDDVAEAYCDPPQGYVRLRPSKVGLLNKFKKSHLLILIKYSYF